MQVSKNGTFFNTILLETGEVVPTYFKHKHNINKIGCQRVIMKEIEAYLLSIINACMSLSRTTDILRILPHSDSIQNVQISYFEVCFGSINLSI
jgi:hypothetical protein